ncbi:MAG: hypothetical protein CR991_04165 [Proteobacteria bacterium]|nr:MAG: hypothetical protein CR991_04165 [Pseudomonadota bacterium]
MKYPSYKSLRLSLILSTTTLFASACSTLPYDETATSNNEAVTYEPSYTANPPTQASIPQANPLTPAPAQTQPQNNYQATAPVYTPPPTYTPPVAHNSTYDHYDVTNNHYDSSNNSSYDTYGSAYQQGDSGDNYNTADNNYHNQYANNSYNSYSNPPQQTSTPAPANNNTSGGIYDYSGSGYDTYNTSQHAANDSYDSYSGNMTYNNSQSSNTNNYYAGNTHSSNQGVAGNVGSSGGAAIQLFASGSSSNAEQARSRMASRGLNVVVDQVNGLYKVRIPFNSESEARANLDRIRSQSGERGAFITFR